MITIDKESKCSGCHACVNICPKQCIEMVNNDEGFLYPYINITHCINCGLCEKVCPFLIIESKRTSEPPTFAVKIKDDEVRDYSSSGGFFSALADYVFDKSGVVYGAAMTDDLRGAHHIRVDKKEELYKLRGSKYLQSIVGDVYTRVKNDLVSGKFVLFSGVPCQINGLKLFLNNNYDNLFTVEVICHGVPSPALWAKYLDHLEKKNNAKIRKVNFREKRNGWKTFGLTKDGDNISQYLSQQEDPYMVLFLKNYCLRESCYKCKVKEQESMADITIADFWGIQNVVPEMYDDKGVSLVIVQSEKGLEVFDIIRNKCVFQQVDHKCAVACNTAYFESVARPFKRDSFFSDMNTMDFNRLAKKYCKVGLKQKIKRIIKRVLRIKTRKSTNNSSFEYGLMFEMIKQK